MSKKSERIKYLVGVRNAINNPDEVTIYPENCIYNKNTIDAILKTIDHVLAEDGIFPMDAKSKVNE